MRSIEKMFSQVRLYSFTAPFVLLPLMGFSVTEVGHYLKGQEFRTFITELLIQITTGVVDAAILAVVGVIFGAF